MTKTWTKTTSWAGRMVLQRFLVVGLSLRGFFALSMVFSE